MRAMVNALGGEVDYDDNTKIATFEIDGREITVNVITLEVRVDGELTDDVKIQLKDDRLYLGARSVANVVGISNDDIDYRTVSGSGGVNSFVGIKSAYSRAAETYIQYYNMEWIYNYDMSARGLMGNTQSERDALDAKILDIMELDKQGLVTGNVYDVQYFNQGNLDLCAAYSQAMIEDYKAGGGMTQEQADARAKAIAQSVHGSALDKDGNDDPTVWDKGIWPTNSTDVYKQTPAIQKVNSFHHLGLLMANGPIYGYYSNGSNAHLIVITGVASAQGHPNLVCTTDPKSGAKIQTYEDFTAGMPNDPVSPPQTFRGVLRPN